MRTKSVDRYDVSVGDNGFVYRDGKCLPVFIDEQGYRSVHVGYGSRPIKKRVYYLVTLAFMGPRPRWAHTRHLNDIKTDDRLCNLSYGTPYENRMDIRRNRLGRGKRRNVGWTPIYNPRLTIGQVTYHTDKFCEWEGNTGTPFAVA